MNQRVNLPTFSATTQKFTLLLFLAMIGGGLYFTLFQDHSPVFGQSACGAFPVNVANEAQLNDAIDCFNTKTLAGTYEINVTGDVLLTASTSIIENSKIGVALAINGNDFKIDGQKTSGIRPITIYTDTVVTISDWLVTGGNVPNDINQPKMFSNGGGISSFGHLTLENSQVISNVVDNGGGGIFSNEVGTLIINGSQVTGNISKDDGGGIQNFGVLNIDNSTISFNKATNFSGGLGVNAPKKQITVTNSSIIGNEANDGGGIYNRRSEMVIANSFVFDNFAKHFGGGILNNRDTAEMTVIDTFISGNTARVGGGGIHNNETARITVLNSTLSGNTTLDQGEINGGGGLLNYTSSYAILQNTTVSGNTGFSGLSNRGVMTLTHVTVANNKDASGTSGFGFTNLTSTVGSEVNFYNTVFADNPIDCVNLEVGGIVQNVNSFIETDSAGNQLCSNNSTLSGDAALGPLQDNGGLSFTHAFPTTSPLRDSADTARCNAMVGEIRDQRGVARPVGAGCDIGAIEYIVGLTIDDISVVETNSGTVNAVFTISRNQNTESISVVVNTKDGTAQAGKDYTPVVNQTVAFAAGGALSKTVSVPVIGDIEFEDDETFELILSNAINSVIVDESGTATIQENQTIQLTISAASNSILEQDSGTSEFVFTFTLESAALGPFSINYATVDGTATAADNDYETKSGVLNFSGAAGSAGAQTVSVTVNGDTNAENNEAFFLEVLSISDSAIGVTPLAFEATIGNDDEPAVNFSSATYSANESSGVAIVTLNLSTSFSLPIMVDVATSDGTAVSGEDYSALNQTITFAPGETVKNVTIALTRGGSGEEDETFTVTVSNPVNSFLGSQTTTTVTIIEDEMVVYLPFITK